MHRNIESSATTFPVNSDRLPRRSLREGRYEVRFAQDREELDAILRLRFEVFNLELGEGLEASHQTGRDEDEFDAFCHHLMVVECESGEVVGSYRLQTAEMARENIGFYSDQEFDLSTFPAQVVRNSVELGRACVAKSHRSTQVLFLLWKGLALYVATNQKRYLFGCSSLTSQDPSEAKSLSEYLESHDYLHSGFTIQPRPEFLCYPGDFVRNPGVKTKVPTLFKTYLRHGAKICGPPAIDRAFKTIDWLVIFDVDQMPRRMFRLFFS
jgi:putative hemolysin